MPLAKLGHKEVSWAYARMAAQEMSSSAMNRAGRALRACLGRAVRLGMATVNCALQVPLPRHRAREVAPLPPEAVQRLLEAARGLRLSALYRLALDSGARQGELLGALSTDFDLEAGEWFVQRSLKRRGDDSRYLKTTKNPHSRRRIPLTRGTITAVRAVIESL